MGFFGSDKEDYYTGQKWNADYGNAVTFNPKAYSSFNPSAYGGGMGANYESAVNQMLSGQLSPAVQQNLNNTFKQNLQSTRTGAYGMPVGAQNYNELQVGSENALQGALLGEQQIATGLSAAMPYLNMGQNENQFTANFGEQQNEFGTKLNLSKAKYAGSLDQEAVAKANADTGIFGSLLRAGTSFGLGKLFPDTSNDSIYNNSDSGNFDFEKSKNNLNANLYDALFSGI
jgi:hypothetical protein